MISSRFLFWILSFLCCSAWCLCWHVVDLASAIICSSSCSSLWLIMLLGRKWSSLANGFWVPHCGGAGSTSRTGAIFPTLLNGQSLIAWLRSHRLSIVRKPFDSLSYNVQACGKNCIWSEEEKIRIVVWLSGHWWVWLCVLHSSTERVSLLTCSTPGSRFSSLVLILLHGQWRESGSTSSAVEE